MTTLNKFLKKGHITTNNKKGFTLIELIVVIAIIGLLASIVMTALGVSRARGEIAKTLGDYKSVANALELYRQSHGGQYPGTEGSAVNLTTLIDNNGVLSEYMKQSPGESPLVVGGTGHMYYYLNTVGLTSPRYWCGDTESDQDYVIYFTPTAQATASGLFQTLYSDPSTAVSNTVCISVNQK